MSSTFSCWWTGLLHRKSFAREGLCAQRSEMDGSSTSQCVSLFTAPGKGSAFPGDPATALVNRRLPLPANSSKSLPCSCGKSVVKVRKAFSFYFRSTELLENHVWSLATQVAPTRCRSPQWLPSCFRKPIAVLLWAEAVKKASAGSVSCWKPAEQLKGHEQHLRYLVCPSYPAQPFRQDSVSPWSA